MNWVLGALIKTLMGWWFKRQQESTMQKMKVEGLRTYLKVLQGARFSAMGIVAFVMVMQLMGFGLALMLGAAIFLSPLEMEIKLWSLVGIGAFLFFLPLFAMLIVFSEKVWYRASGADRMVKKVLDFENAS